MEVHGDGVGVRPYGEVTPGAVIAVLAEKTGVPEAVIAGHVREGAGSGSSGLKERLLQRVVGQDEAVDRVCRRLLLAQPGLDERRGPLGVFLFMGPSGVGKTELARALAEALFGSDSSLVRLDMSEYMEQHSVARLIGSPPGYIGHDEEGQLTGKLRTTPYAVVLLDEVEKAHPRVLDVFLQVFDDGRLTDGKGRTVDAKNAIFIMTSNIGGGPQMSRKPLGFAPEGEEAVVEPEADPADLKKYFRTEFINRLDEIVRFRPLTEIAIAEITQKMLDALVETVRRKYQVELHVEPEVIQALCSRAQSAEFGARHLRRAVQDAIEIPLTQLLVAAGADGKSRIRCRVDGGEIRVVQE
jgi:ATP-dependent Clp protease ATP-binding subunit ClpA